MNTNLFNGLKGLVTSSKSNLVILVLMASFFALFTKHLASNDFAQIWYVIVPAWLTSHAATRWAPATTPTDSSAPNPAKATPPTDPNAVP